MAVLRWSQMVLAAKKESSYASEATLAGTDSVLCTDVSLEPIVSTALDRETIDGKFGSRPFVQTNTHVSLTATVEATASGTAGTSPDYKDLLLGCGLIETSTASQNVFAPETNLETADSLTIGLYIDGSLHKLTGARGSVSYQVNAGDTPKFVFTYLGLYNAPTAATLLSPTYAQEDPLVANSTNTTAFQLHSYAGALNSFTFDQNNDLYYSELIGSTKTIRIRNRASSGTVSIESVGLGTKNYYELTNSTGTGNLTHQHGQTAGSKITFTAGKTQLETIGQGDNEGYQMLDIGYRALPDSGNDEFELKFH
tara:strand:- start:2233 stop:3165 length:933 start_codon:yes stop_codon:yes gene_type:complete